MMWTADRIHISTLRVRGVTEDKPELRLILASLLSNADVYPPGIPPSAILIVRHVADPLPGQVAPHRNAVRINSAWEQAVQNAVADIYRRATRPVQGRLSADAEAVLFADEGEMLACLALDIHRGEAMERWWWKHILRFLTLSSTDDLCTLLCQQAQYGPALFQHLASWRQAGSVIASLSPDQAIAVTSAICRAYCLPDFTCLAVRGKALPNRNRHERVDYHDAHEEKDIFRPEPPWVEDTPSLERLSAAWEPPALPPWASFLSLTSIPKHLDRERQCLLGMGLSLYLAPATVRTEAFLQTLERWWNTQEKRSATAQALRRGRVWQQHEMRRRRLPVSQEDAKRAHIQVIDNPTTVFIADEVTHRPSSGPEPVRPGLDAPEQSRVPEAEAIPDPALPMIHLTPTPQQGSNDPGPPGVTETEAIPDPTLPMIHLTPTPRPGSDEPGPPEVPEAEGIPDPVLPFSDGTTTHLSGVFYLINLMESLGLPACCEAEWRLASQVGAWGVLEVLARALLGQAYDELAVDPLWKALAELDNRAPGSLAGERLQVDVSDHLPPYDSPDSQLLAGLHPRLKCWLSMSLPGIRIRLQQLLGITDDPQELVLTLLLYRGHLYISSTHVDVVMHLDDISLPVRLAGLDQNPGWQPDFARVIQFHFTSRERAERGTVPLL